MNGRTYINPVHLRPCPDPFVLKFLNEYWCYSTGISEDGRSFPVLHSRDLIKWRELGGALVRFDPDATCWWAPEVTYANGIFRMYYSVGNETRMQIRVGEAAHPAGPYVDLGVGITNEEFAIDPHVFIDDDGTQWLFYATDFLTHSHIGTGTVRDRMLDPYKLAGEPQPVTRARYDWQLYDPDRKEKGGVRWHTVEGPFVVKRKGLYYQMFSGGNWKNESYGASFATSDTLSSEGEWDQFSDGERSLPILRTIPGKVIGPGHNSLVRGPDNRQFFCIYHCWSEIAKDRVLAIDRLDWAGPRLLVVGPTFTQQPLPIEPTFEDYFNLESDGSLAAGWEFKAGEWSSAEGFLIQEQSNGRAEALCLTGGAAFVTEVSVKVQGEVTSASSAGIRLSDSKTTFLSFVLSPQKRQAIVDYQSHGILKQQPLPLPRQFDFNSFHLLRTELNSGIVRINVDDQTLAWNGKLDVDDCKISLVTEETSAVFAGFAVTRGWEDLFDEPGIDVKEIGWKTSDPSRWYVRDRQLWCGDGEASLLAKVSVPGDYELIVNATLGTETGSEACYGFLPAIKDNEELLFTLGRAEGRWALLWRENTDLKMNLLPIDFDPFTYQQFRFRLEQQKLLVWREGDLLAEVNTVEPARRIGVYARRATVGFDMVRLTAIVSRGDIQTR